MLRVSVGARRLAGERLFDSPEGKRKAGRGWRWVEGVVDTNDDHIKIRHGKPPTEDQSRSVGARNNPVVLVARGRGKTFTVQFLLTPRRSDRRSAAILKDVRRELDFYLIDHVSPDPWAYAQYHCYTAANVYSKVHWGWYPKGPRRSSEPHSSRVIRRRGRKFVFSPMRPSA